MQQCINIPYFRNILFSPLINRHVPSSLSLGCSKPTAAGQTWSRSTHFKEENLADPAAGSLLLCLSMAFFMPFGLTITCQQFLCHPEKLLWPLASCVKGTGQLPALRDFCGKMLQTMEKQQRTPGTTFCLYWGTGSGILFHWGGNSPGTAMQHSCSAVPLSAGEPGAETGDASANLRWRVGSSAVSVF